MWSSRRSWPLAVVVAAALLLSSCGFRLQGVDDFPASLTNTYIDTANRYTPFYRELSIALEQGGVTLVSSRSESDAVIRIEEDRTGQRVLTVSARNVPTEYDVYYTVTYSVSVGGAEAIPSRKLTLSQDYTYDETLVLGKKREEEIIRNALTQNLVRQVSRELSQL